MLKEESTTYTYNWLAGRALVIFLACLVGIIGGLLCYTIGRSISSALSIIFNTSIATSISTADDLIIQSGKVGAFFRMVIWAPLIEETLFRLWQRYSIRNLIFSLSALSVFIFIQYARLSKEIISSFTIFNISATAIFSLTFLLLWKNRDKLPDKIDLKKTPTVVISSILFGIIHIFNYDLEKTFWIICLPMILPQVFSGLLFATLRWRYGFVYGIIVHSILNFSSLIFSIYFS